MTKFNKFLDEEKFKEKQQKNTNTNNYTSLKIKSDTLNKLRKLKLITKDDSYSVLISQMIDSYIKELSEEQQNKLKTIL